jgi:hypothetical protein
LDEKERKIVAFDKDAKKAYQKARKKGIEVPILFRVPSETIPYVGTPFWV